MFSVTLADCVLQTFRSGGKGGQNQNKRETGVRILHRASGAVGESREERSQWQNKQAAWRRLVASGKFRAWVNRQVWQAGENPEAAVRRSMQPHNLLVEGRRDGEWTLIG